MSQFSTRNAIRYEQQASVRERERERERERDLDTIIKSMLSHLQRLQGVLLLLSKVYKTTFKVIKRLKIVRSYN